MLQFLRSIPKVLKVMALSFFIILLVSISFLSLKKQFVKLNKSNSDYLVEIDANRVELFDGYSNVYLDSTNKSILQEKVKIIQKQREQHLNLMNILLQDYYAFLTLFPILSGLAGLFAFILLQNGWKGSNLYLKTAFVNVTLLSAITGIFPDVYEQESNIANYTGMYMKYSKLQKDIFNYNLTAPLYHSDTIAFDRFLIQVNDREKELIEYRLGMQKKEITKDAFDFNK